MPLPANRDMPRLLSRVLLLLLALSCSSASFAAKSSYAELIEEDRLGLSAVEKNARTFLRQIEVRGGRPLTQEEMRKAYANRVSTLRGLETESAMKQIEVIRQWVRQVGPVLSEADGRSHPVQGPLHLVLQTASDIVGHDRIDKEHPHREAKKIVVGMRRFTEAIVKYFNARASETLKEEL